MYNVCVCAWPLQRQTEDVGARMLLYVHSCDDGAVGGVELGVARTRALFQRECCHVGAGSGNAADDDAPCRHGSRKVEPAIHFRPADDVCVDRNVQRVDVADVLCQQRIAARRACVRSDGKEPEDGPVQRRPRGAVASVCGAASPVCTPDGVLDNAVDAQACACVVQHRPRRF